MTNEIEVRQQETASVESFIQQAIAANVPVETLERLFTLREKVKAEQAKEAFVQALSKFQSECPVIEKRKIVLNNNGTVRYKFAPLEDIVEQIRKPVTDNGFSYTWDTVKKDGEMKVTCKLTHKLGHFDTSTLEIPIDKDGFMTAPQKVASAQTFAKRNTLCNALGISTGDEDTDATDVNKEKDVKSSKSKIVFLLRSLKVPHKTTEECEVSVKKMTQLDLKDENFPEIITRLQANLDERHDS